MKGVATLYRWSIAAQHQQNFIRQWRAVARQMRQLGARGCHLLRSKKGEFIGLIMWPSDYARSRASTMLATYALPGIHGFVETELRVEDDVGSAVLGEAPADGTR